MTNSASSKAVFIDRDGTLIEEVNFLSRIKDLRFFPFTLEAVELLKENGFLVIVVTNQSGIGRNIFGEDDMHAIHDEIQSHVGGRLDKFYYCPHRPDEGCRCRKPNLGMIEDARSDFGIDFEKSWMIGDKQIDIETGFNAGLGTAMVLTGYGKQHLSELTRQPDIVAENLLEAARAIIK
jgi:histidinol-phosphate phosphatase family domain/HAD-superfamily hydrolase, subfamily IIIA